MKSGFQRGRLLGLGSEPTEAKTKVLMKKQILFFAKTVWNNSCCSRSLKMKGFGVLFRSWTLGILLTLGTSALAQTDQLIYTDSLVSGGRTGAGPRSTWPTPHRSTPAPNRSA